MPIDLTVFSGEELDSTIVNLPQLLTMRGRSRQRDGKIGAVDQNACSRIQLPTQQTNWCSWNDAKLFLIPSNTPFYNSLSFLNTAEFQ